MRHPSEAQLALHAGGDLGALARWRVERHVRRCEQCREEVSSYASLRTVLPDLSETPELAWSRLAAEMRANIRLGLEAGECVRESERVRVPQALFGGWRGMVAVASVLTLLVTGLMLDHPPVPKMAVARHEGIVVERMQDGIQVGEDGQALVLRHDRKLDVTYQVGAQGSMRARYVDPDTGYVTINNVYAE
jgi:hypothetical protein